LQHTLTASTDVLHFVVFFYLYPTLSNNSELVASPKVKTYDLKPEMSATEVAERVVRALSTGNYPFVMCNFAPPDMVGHTGTFF
jgi:bisphosphoglycerate-independent phosphoglycerate mutase (AlkP superfamily)